MSSFGSINDIGSVVQANVSYSVGLFNKAYDKLIIRLIEMFIIYFNSVLQVAINKRQNNSLEFRGVLASFLLGILLFFPSVRRHFTAYLQKNNNVILTYFVVVIYTITGSYTYSKFLNVFNFIEPKDKDPTQLACLFLVALETYIRDTILVSNFILGKQYLSDTLLLTRVLKDIFGDPNFSWSDSEGLFNILIDSSIFLFTQLGLKTEAVSGCSSQSTLSIYSMSFFEGIIYYKSEVNPDIYLFLVCIVFEIGSVVCIKLEFVKRCLSQWDARLKPNYTWDVYWRSFIAYVLSGTYDFTHMGNNIIAFNSFKFEQTVIDMLESYFKFPSLNDDDDESPIDPEPSETDK